MHGRGAELRGALLLSGARGLEARLMAMKRMRVIYEGFHGKARLVPAVDDD